MKNLILIIPLLFLFVGCTKNITAIDQTNRSYLIQPKNHTIAVDSVNIDSTQFYAHFDVVFDVSVDENTVIELVDYREFVSYTTTGYRDVSVYINIDANKTINNIRLKRCTIINSNTIRFNMFYQFLEHKPNFNPRDNIDSVSATIILSNPKVY